jgi:hypothetical protein
MMIRAFEFISIRNDGLGHKLAGWSGWFDKAKKWKAEIKRERKKYMKTLR